MSWITLVTTLLIFAKTVLPVKQTGYPARQNIDFRFGRLCPTYSNLLNAVHVASCVRQNDVRLGCSLFPLGETLAFSWAVAWQSSQVG